jgi:hypothetical protein
MTGSVSGIPGGSQRPAADGRVCSVSWVVTCPMVTGVVRCDPVVRGPDVAPMWPSGPELGRRVRSRLRGLIICRWRRSRPPSGGPLLTVSDRQMPMLRARGGHGRRGPTALRRGGDGHKVNRRVRLVHDDHLPCWQAAKAARQSERPLPCQDRSKVVTTCDVYLGLADALGR